jgi:hypothetical protein
MKPQKAIAPGRLEPHPAIGEEIAPGELTIDTVVALKAIHKPDI